MVGNKKDMFLNKIRLSNTIRSKKLLVIGFITINNSDPILFDYLSN